MSVLKLNKSLHKWLSLLVGVQLIIWLVTGLYFNLMDHHKAGGHEYRVHAHNENQLSEHRLKPIAEVRQSGHTSNSHKPAKLSSNSKNKAPFRVQQVWVLDKPYYHFVYQAGQHSYQKRDSELFDAVTGQPVSLTPSQVLSIAQKSYSGPGTLMEPVLRQPPFADYVAQQNPMWQVDVADANNTTIYLDAVTGRVLRHANNDFRLKELMMKLHFMDYGNTGGFNHWLIISFALATLLLSITGVTWLVQRYQNGQLKVSWRRAPHSIAVTFIEDGTSCDISTYKNESVLDGLANSRVYLPSSCGGGGTCGKCIFKSTETLTITSIEQEQLTPEDLAQGYRLGCQHLMSEVNGVEVASSKNIDTYELIVVATQFITPFIKEIKFKVKSGEQLAFKAGAYMEFDIPPGTNELRPNDLPKAYEKYWRDYTEGAFSHEGASRHYSLANFDQETDELIFNIRWQTSTDGQRGGVGSTYLGSLEVGQTITAKGPFSDFSALTTTPDIKSRRRLFIGAGSGLAPLRSIIFEALKKHQYQGEMALIYGARTEDDLLYQVELESLASEHANFTYVPTLSSPSEEWDGHVGYVQEVLSGQFSDDLQPHETEFYLCGPEAMMEAVENLLRANGVPQDLILKDKFSR